MSTLAAAAFSPTRLFFLEGRADLIRIYGGSSMN